MRHHRCSRLIGIILFFGLIIITISGAVAQKYGGTVIFGTTIEPETFNPYISEENATSLRLCELMYEGLVAPRTIIDPRSAVEVIPIIAREFHPSAPGANDTEFTFVLRQNVFWHPTGDGQKHQLTARDVKFTVDYIKNSPAIPTIVKERYACIEDVTVLSEHSVRIMLDQPRYNALYLFTFKILPRHCFTADYKPVSADLNINRRPVGTGPFVFDTWDPFTNLIHFHAFDSYWNDAGRPAGRARAYLDSIRVKIIPDEDFLHQALLTGAIDIMAQVKPGYINEIQSEPNLTLAKYLNNRTAFLALNNAEAPFDAEVLRCGLGYASDRKKIVDDVFLGHATIVDGPLPPWFLPEVPTNPRATNRDLCREILAGEGYVDTNGNGVRDHAGEDLGFDIIYPEQVASGSITTVCQHISVALEEVGVEGEPHNIDYRSFLRRLYESNDYSAAYVDVSLESVSSVSALFHSSQSTRVSPRGRNFMNFKNVRVDSLIELYESALNSERRLQVASQLQKEISDHCPAVFLWCVSNFAGQNLRVQGVQIDPLVFFRNVQNWYVTD